MGAMSFHITDVSIVYWTVCSDADQRKHQSSSSLAFVREIHRWPVNSPHKGPVTRKLFPFDDVFLRLFENWYKRACIILIWYIVRNKRLYYISQDGKLSVSFQNKTVLWHILINPYHAWYFCLIWMKSSLPIYQIKPWGVRWGIMLLSRWNVCVLPHNISMQCVCVLIFIISPPPPHTHTHTHTHNNPPPLSPSGEKTQKFVIYVSVFTVP